MTRRSGYWWLPHLADFQVTSESTPQYNCFAWALGLEGEFEYSYGRAAVFMIRPRVSD